MVLIFFGSLFMIIGFFLFFHRVLLALGISFFLANDRLPMIVKMKGSLSFVGGIGAILLGWPVVGIILELYGLFVLSDRSLFSNIMHWILCIQIYCIGYTVENFFVPLELAIRAGWSWLFGSDVQKHNSRVNMETRARAMEEKMEKWSGIS